MLKCVASCETNVSANSCDMTSDCTDFGECEECADAAIVFVLKMSVGKFAQRCHGTSKQLMLARVVVVSILK